jgi:ATP-dependent DNA helicase RecQ
MKVYIIKSIDNKKPLDDIADAKGLDMQNLLTEIETIVNSGTRLNLSYYIDSVIDDDHQEDIFTYFKEEAETDSLQEALDELGDDYEEDEIRLMRIKFLSELGN